MRAAARAAGRGAAPALRALRADRRGTSVIDPDGAAVTGFHHVLARDAPGSEPTEDLAARAPAVPARPWSVNPHPRQQEYA
ncbi:hypothetical protein GCM10023238_10980 [Streptomyces heliomycini]